jgi:hypothetical protein
MDKYRMDCLIQVLRVCAIGIGIFGEEHLPQAFVEEGVGCGIPVADSVLYLPTVGTGVATQAGK